MIERKVQDCVEKYLKVKIGAMDRDFFEQGLLDSFESINLVMALEKEFTVKFEIADFSENRDFSVKNIAQAIARRGGHA